MNSIYFKILLFIFKKFKFIFYRIEIFFINNRLKTFEKYYNSNRLGDREQLQIRITDDKFTRKSKESFVTLIFYKDKKIAVNKEKEIYFKGHNLQAGLSFAFDIISKGTIVLYHMNERKLCLNKIEINRNKDVADNCKGQFDKISSWGTLFGRIYLHTLTSHFLFLLKMAVLLFIVSYNGLSV